MKSNLLHAVMIVGLILAACTQLWASDRQPWKTDPESAILQKNWDALKDRHLRLLPVPKRLEFTGEEIVLAGKGARKIVIVLEQTTPRGKIAANEIQSRWDDFTGNLQVKFTITTKKVAGAYNIIIENHWPNTFTNDFARPAAAKKTDQAYGLYPQKG